MVKEESIVLAQDGAFMRMEIGDSGYNNPGTALVHSCYFAKFAAAFFLDQRSSAKIWGEEGFG